MLIVDDEVGRGFNGQSEIGGNGSLIAGSCPDEENSVLRKQLLHRIFEQIAAFPRCGIEELTEGPTVVALMQEDG